MAFTTIVLLVTFLANAVSSESPQFGLFLPKLETKIVGGQNASAGQFAYQVSLQWGLPPIIPFQHFCGGSILNEKWILTAAHCVKAVPSFGSFVIKAGKNNIKKKEPGEQEIKVQKTFVHQNYTGGVAPYDIGLLLLSKSLVFNKNVFNVTLPSQNVIQTGFSVLSGWGSMSNTSRPNMPNTLQYAELPIISLSTCKNAVESIAGPSPLHSTNMCTGPLTGAYSACSGDSGGPLVAKTKSKEVIGIVSWGIMPCGTTGAPSVYTRTSAFVDWIKTIMNINTL